MIKKELRFEKILSNQAENLLLSIEGSRFLQILLSKSRVIRSQKLTFEGSGKLVISWQKKHLEPYFVILDFASPLFSKSESDKFIEIEKHDNLPNEVFDHLGLTIELECSNQSEAILNKCYLYYYKDYFETSNKLEMRSFNNFIDVESEMVDLLSVVWNYVRVIRFDFSSKCSLLIERGDNKGAFIGHIVENIEGDIELSNIIGDQENLVVEIMF